MSATEELKPCPFCGGDDIYADVGIYAGKEWLSVTVKCRDCEASIWDYTLEEAIAAWNRRADHE